MNRSSADLNLRYALRALRRRLPLFILCVLLVPALAVAVSVLQKKEYTATASLYFRDPQFDQKLFGTSYVPTQPDPAIQQATNLDLVSLPRVAALTAAHLHGITQDQVTSAVTESGVGQSDLVSIQATSPSPGFAARLANTFATQYIAFRRDADRATIVAAELPLQNQIASLPTALRNGSLGQSLQSRLSQLKVLASLQTGDAELAQPAEVPRGASSPKVARNGAIGLFFGILLGIGVVLLTERLDRRLHDVGEIEQIFGRPLLATLAESAALTTPDAGLLAVPEAEREGFRMLWANLRYFTFSHDIRTVLVTSADRDDGKSTVSWGLGSAAASAGARVLVIEADLRNPTFATRFNLRAPVGLTSVLAGDVALADAVMRYRFPHSGDDRRPTRSMDVLFAGPRPPDPSDLLQSQRMADFLTEATDEYNFIVIDTPPLPAVSDAIPLVSLVDGVTVVVRLGNTLRDHARRLRQELEHLDAPILGIVVNAAEEAEPYGYAYADGYRPPSPRPPRRTDWVRARADRDPTAVVGASSPADEGGRPRAVDPS